MGSSFRNVWSPRGVTPGPNGAAQLNFGDELQVLGDALGVVGLAVVEPQSRAYAGGVQRFYENGADQDTAATTRCEKCTENVLFGGTGRRVVPPAPRRTRCICAAPTRTAPRTRCASTRLLQVAGLRTT